MTDSTLLSRPSVMGRVVSVGQGRHDTLSRDCRQGICCLQGARARCDAPTRTISSSGAHWEAFRDDALRESFCCVEGRQGAGGVARGDDLCGTFFLGGGAGRRRNCWQSAGASGHSLGELFLVAPKSAMSCWYALASSSGLSQAGGVHQECVAEVDLRRRSRMIAGIVVSPASSEARRRRSSVRNARQATRRALGFSGTTGGRAYCERRRAGGAPASWRRIGSFRSSSSKTSGCFIGDDLIDSNFGEGC